MCLLVFVWSEGGLNFWLFTLVFWAGVRVIALRGSAEKGSWIYQMELPNNSLLLPQHFTGLTLSPPSPLETTAESKQIDPSWGDLQDIVFKNLLVNGLFQGDSVQGKPLQK